MTPKDRQHIVPQMHLKKFADPNSGKLFVYSKKRPGHIRTSSVKNIGWRDSYYTDDLGSDFDSRFLQNIETLFGRTYGISNLESERDQRAICWYISTVLWRTDMATELLESLLNRRINTSDPVEKKYINGFRSKMMNHMRVWLGRQICIQVLDMTPDSLLTSDHPAILLHLDPHEPAIALMPISPSRCILVGPPDTPTLAQSLTTTCINRLIIGWAQDEIYTSTRQLALWCDRVLDPQNTVYNPLWKSLARRPYFGFKLWAPHFITPPPPAPHRVVSGFTPIQFEQDFRRRHSMTNSSELDHFRKQVNGRIAGDPAKIGSPPRDTPTPSDHP